MAEIEVNGKKFKISTPLARNPGQSSASRTVNTQRINVAGVGQAGSRDHGNEGVYISSDYYRNDIVGKPYPGRVNFNTQRVLAYNSTVVRSILTLRSHQVAKLPITIIPKNKDEPPKQMSILEYNVYDLEHHPAFDFEEVRFLTRIYSRLDPKSYLSDKKAQYEEQSEEFTPGERATLAHLQEKHDDFYRKRQRDIKEIKKLLSKPDPWFTETLSWESLIKKMLIDTLIIDRGALIKIREEGSNKIHGLMPIDGSTLRPLINEFGTFDDEKAFVQVVNGTPRTYLSKKDVMIMSMNPMTDIKYYGYGFSMMETLYTTVLSDIFIDKGNLDYYRKGGSIPEGFISIEPPPSREGVVSQVDQEQLETIQRHLQSIMMGDYTQVPIVSGGKVSWIDFKGKRRDMQFKELAEYLTRKICAVYQVSPQDVGIISDVNRSTSQTQAEMTKSKGLETVMRTISEHFTNNIISELRPEDDLMLWFQDDDIEKEKERWQISQQKIIAGALTINQYRALEGQHPVPWGNTPLQGLRNWKPEEENSGGMPGMPNLGNLPPISGVPSPDNPNGPVGGDNPMAGGPPQPAGGPSPVGSPTNLKSSRFFGLSAASEDDAEELMIKSFSNMYMENAKFSDFLELHDIHNYPGSAVLRTPIESYEFLARENRDLGITVHKQVEVDEADPLVFSKYVGNGNIIVSEDGEEPIIKSMAKAAFDSMGDERASQLRENLGSDEAVREAIERSMYSRLDPGLKSFLYDDFYKFVTPNVTDAQVQEVGEYLGLK